MKRAVAVRKKSKAARPVKHRAAEKPRLGVGMGSILARAPEVSEAFGRSLGFTIMMTAILATTSVSATMLIILAKGISRFL